MIRIIKTAGRIILQKSNMHTLQSHQHDKSKFLSIMQRNAIKTVMKSNPHATPTQVRRVLKDFSPTKVIPASKLTSVRHAVRKERVEMVEMNFNGLKLTDTHGSLTQLCESMLLSNLVKRHNDSDDDFHFKMHTTVVCSYCLDGGEFTIIIEHVQFGDILISYRRLQVLHGYG